MADHDVSSQNPMASLRAFTAPLFRGLTAAIVVFIIYAFVNGGSGGSTNSTASPSASPGIASESSMPGTVTGGGGVTTDASNGALVNPNASPGVIAGSASEGLNTSDKPGVGVKVQVLQGASTSKSSYESAVSRLKQLGYTVKTGGKASKDYDTTTIFVVKGKESEAEALKSADPRFKETKDKPDSITAKDDVHVVVGSDWVAAAGESSGSSSSESASEGSSKTKASASASASASPGLSGASASASYDPSTSAALPAGAQGAAQSNTVPNFAGAAANTANVNNAAPAQNAGTVVNPAPSATSN